MNYSEFYTDKVAYTVDNVINNLNNIKNNNKYKVENFFELYDKDNCKRHYELIKDI